MVFCPIRGEQRKKKVEKKRTPCTHRSVCYRNNNTTRAATICQSNDMEFHEIRTRQKNWPASHSIYCNATATCSISLAVARSIVMMNTVIITIITVCRGALFSERLMVLCYYYCCYYFYSFPVPVRYSYCHWIVWLPIRNFIFNLTKRKRDREINKWSLGQIAFIFMSSARYTLYFDGPIYCDP